MMTALASGAFLDFSFGLAPGPLPALPLAQTLRHSPRESRKVALAPLFTDAPLIVVTLVLAVLPVRFAVLLLREGRTPLAVRWRFSRARDFA